MRLLVSLTALAFVPGCNSNASPERTETGSVSQEAEAALLAYGEAISTGNIETAATYYDRDSDFHWVERGAVTYESGDAAAESLESLMTPGTSSTMTFDQIHTADLGPNSAVVSAHFDFSITDNHGEAAFGFDGWMTVAMVRRPEGWCFAAGQVGPGTPAEE